MANTRTSPRGAAVLALCALLGCAAAVAQDPPPAPEPQPQKPAAAKHKDRVYLTDLEGTWISR